MKKDITELYVIVDDFCQQYARYFNSQIFPRNHQPTRIPCLQIREIMTIILLFHQSPAKNFKFFYKSYLTLYQSEFPTLPSYTRFIELQQRCLGHFHALLMLLCALATRTGLSYIDSTPILSVTIKEFIDTKYSKV